MVETAKQAVATLAKTAKGQGKSILDSAVAEGWRLRQQDPAAYVQQIMGDPGWQTQLNSGIQYTGGGLSNAQYSNAAEVLASQSNLAGRGLRPQDGPNKGQ